MISRHQGNLIKGFFTRNATVHPEINKSNKNCKICPLKKIPKETNIISPKKITSIINILTNKKKLYGLLLVVKIFYISSLSYYSGSSVHNIYCGGISIYLSKPSVHFS